MKHKVYAVTGTRAEFGLLTPLLRRLNDDADIDFRLLVTGSHLSAEYGNTYSEIEASGFPVLAALPILTDGDDKAAMADAAGQALSSFSRLLSVNRPELLVVLGDRYEIFAAAAAAAILGIPIAHIHGGETTEGAVDEFLRHSITKMSYLHFTACEEYRKRVIQLGEAPERVFNVGALGVENTLSMPLISREELSESLGMELSGRYSVVTMHPVTLENNTGEEQLYSLIAAMDSFPDMKYIITKSNADAGGRTVNRIWDAEAAKHENWRVVASLGARRYLSALKGASMMIGNSSSGIIEAPAAHIPTVNIGDRQRGRMMAESVICCPPDTESIAHAMKKALSPEFIRIAEAVSCPFGSGNTSALIHKQLRKALDDTIDIKKSFYDVDYDMR